jgi:hypothetical protein
MESGKLRDAPVIVVQNLYTVIFKNRETGKLNWHGFSTQQDLNHVKESLPKVLEGKPVGNLDFVLLIPQWLTSEQLTTFLSSPLEEKDNGVY